MHSALLRCSLATRYDLVITSYGILAADFQQKAAKKESGKGKEKQPLPVSERAAAGGWWEGGGMRPSRDGEDGPGLGKFGRD